MKLKRAQAIRQFWDNTDDGDMSTEMLFSLVGEHFGIDHGDVSEALFLTRRPEEIASTKEGGK